MTKNLLSFTYIIMEKGDTFKVELIKQNGVLQFIRTIMDIIFTFHNIEFIQKSNQFTMKGQSQDHDNREKHSNKGNHKFFHPHKEFQLLYRSCDKLPSSQQYESVFFMKHKKISPQKMENQKKKSGKKREGGKKKTPKDKDGKGHSSQNFSSKGLKEDRMAVTKTTIPTSTGEKFGKNSFAETFRKKIDLTKSSLKKIKNQSPSSSSRYLVPKGISQKKDKIISSTNKKTQNLQRMKSPKKMNSPKMKKLQDKSFPISKRNRELSFIEEQYILIEGKFVSAETPDCQYLQQKLRIDIEQQEKNQFVEESFTKLHQYPEIVQPPMQMVRQSENSLQQQREQFIFQTIVKIQRWWRKILYKRKNNYNQVPKFQRNQTGSEKIEPSIQFFITQKQKTVVNYMNHKKNLLNKLHSHKKITQKEYCERMSQIQQYFQKQMKQIIKLRKLFASQALTIKKMQQQMDEQQKQEFFDIQNVPTSTIMQKFTQIKNDEQYQDFQILTPSILNSSIARKKSTGCHIAQDQNPSEIQGKQNSPSHSEQEISPLGNRQFFSQQKSDEDDQDEQGAVEASGQFKQLFEIYQDRQAAQLQIEKRHGIQLGMTVQQQTEYGISTSVVSIHKFLSGFLQFYLYFFKQQFLKMINMPYGYSQKSRLKLLQGISQQKIERYSILDDQEVIYGVQTVMGSQILDDYHQHQYQADLTNNDTAKAMIMFEQIHNRAIFDCFNEELNAFRPYFYINGPPYTWNYSQRALTFYYIAEQNIQQVFEKTQYKVLKNSSSLCGTLVDPLCNTPVIQSSLTLQETLSKYRQCVNPVLMQNREQKLSKVEKQEICDTNYKWEDVEELRTGILMEIGMEIMQMLMKEGVQECMTI